MPTTVSLDGLRKSLAATDTVAVVTSRLGKDLQRQRTVCRFLTRSMLACRSRKATLLVASKSAIEPWAIRAAELFDVPTLRVAVGKPDTTADFFVTETHLSRDQMIIELADRVDALYIRRGGTIERALQSRVEARCDASTRVAIASADDHAGANLIAAGAIGWWIDSPTANAAIQDAVIEQAGDSDWMRSDGQWLIHCTRAPTGPWPDETPRQYRDAILIGDEASMDRQPIDSLQRIIQRRCLIANARASDHRYSVVCFSALSLTKLLLRRCFRPHLGRWDYEPYGIAIRRSAAESMGVQPVIYGEAGDRKLIAPRDQFRFHPVGQTYDWRAEQEWRSPQSLDLTQFAPGEIRIFAPATQTAKNRLIDSPWPVSFISQTMLQSV